MSSSVRWRDLLDRAASLLRLEITEYCESINGRENPRYFHANAHSPGDSSRRWRLKTVNPAHTDHRTGSLDYQSIQLCNRNNNIIHSMLAGCAALKSVLNIPDYFPVPYMNQIDISCSELLAGEPPGTADLESIVAMLLKVRQNSRGLFKNIAHYEINRYNLHEYRVCRLHVSIDSMRNQGLLLSKEAAKVKETFDQDFKEPLSVEELSLVHGDFSFGNLKMCDREVFFIDFEHSHAGAGELDLAHLFVNLRVNGNTDAAATLLSLYAEQAAQLQLELDRGLFGALVLERVAGKMNSMSNREGPKWEQSKSMLLDPKTEAV